MKERKDEKDMDYYMELKYPVLLSEDPDGGYVAEIPDLPGCMSGGDTAEEALEMIEDARYSWIESQLEEGKEVPLPDTIRAFNGRVLVRMSKALHERLYREAKRQEISLNSYINELLSRRYVLEMIEEKVDDVMLRVNEFSSWSGFQEIARELIIKGYHTTTPQTAWGGSGANILSPQYRVYTEKAVSSVGK